MESSPPTIAMSTSLPSPVPLPRVTIRFCTQCKWMLRAAYFAQELLSTFSTALGEVALQPSTGGTFVVEIAYTAEQASASAPSAPPAASTPSDAAGGLAVQHRVLWDRKVDGGFPETKELKRRVRDVIEPGRNLGHVDREYPTRGSGGVGGDSASDGGAGGEKHDGQTNKEAEEQPTEEELQGIAIAEAAMKAAAGVTSSRKKDCEDCQ
ncbi:Rdx family-domain-containing protein [Microdochium bolleyi]|uniref:Rdx family-domain-containing protein n=1 Tax=Microdochium bolleyi TaxID=196109 RepID=A0A136JCA2_9PEZI|nr:Rdx family-domain-containing protein [Microdochium bolleyi]